MREILFRGKRLQGGDWVYGYFFKSDMNKRERESGKATLIFTPDCDTFIMVPEWHNSFMVDADTVGQFTGLTDKNGKRIFEGDIIRYNNEDFVVEYTEGFASYSLKSPCNMRQAPAITPITVRRLEVIGNIHDNPELLE